jgi:hypothetical protein
MASKKPKIRLYRNAKYDYSKPDATTVAAIGTDATCGCQCGLTTCKGPDAMALYNGIVVTPASSLLKFKPNQHYTNQHYTQPCFVCKGIHNAMKSMFQGQSGPVDFGPAFQARLLPSVREEGTTMRQGYDKYERIRTNGETRIREAIAKLQQQRAAFLDRANQMQALKDKVRVGHELLNAAADKLHSLGDRFNTLRQQNGLQYEDKVAVGLPYFPPFFKVSNRNYVVMMVCVNVLMLVGILVYAFYGRTETDVDITRTHSPAAAVAATAPSTQGAPEPSSAAAPLSEVDQVSPDPPPDTPSVFDDESDEYRARGGTKVRGKNATGARGSTSRVSLSHRAYHD